MNDAEAAGPGRLLAELQAADELVVEPPLPRPVQRFDDDRLSFQRDPPEQRRDDPDEGGDESGDRGDDEQDHERPRRQFQRPVEQKPEQQAAGQRQHAERHPMQHRPALAEAAEPAHGAAERFELGRADGHQTIPLRFRSQQSRQTRPITTAMVSGRFQNVTTAFSTARVGVRSIACATAFACASADA